MLTTKIINKKRFISEQDFIIPSFKDYLKFETENYSLNFLKEISKIYKLKLSGNKTTLKSRIFEFLKYSFFAIKIQKNYKRFLIKNYLKLFGPALFNKDCINDTDFFTLENINKIRIPYFISYSDINNKIWGFNIKSLYNLFLKSNSNTLNPYTREIINIDVYDNIIKIIKLSKIIYKEIDLKINEDNNINLKKKIEFKVLELFQIIDNLGNYTDIKWFLTLNRYNLSKFIYQLYDIWVYRAQLENNIKISICYPSGNPFHNCNINNINQYTFYSLQKLVLQIIEEFITKGINTEMCNLGASYILCAFTLVSNDAAIAMPWLYESVAQ